MQVLSETLIRSTANAFRHKVRGSMARCGRGAVLFGLVQAQMEESAVSSLGQKRQQKKGLK